MQNNVNTIMMPPIYPNANAFAGGATWRISCLSAWSWQPSSYAKARLAADAVEVDRLVGVVAAEAQAVGQKVGPTNKPRCNCIVGIRLWSHNLTQLVQHI